MKHSFFGGVYPAGHKENTRRKPIARLEQPPGQVVIPLLMSHTGDAVSLVRQGERVCVGQPLSRGVEEGASVHASVSGVVEAVEERAHPWGRRLLSVVIRNDGKNTPWPQWPAPLDLEKVTAEQLIERTGIVGMGGGAYPTALKLRQAAGKIDTLIVNAAECEPYVTADHRLLLERSGHVLQGAQVIARCLGASRAVVVTEGDKLNAVEAVERRMRRRNAKVELCTAGTRYPLGAEKQIVQTVTGREVFGSKLPLDVGCLVLNVATVFAVQEALARGRALTHRVVTVAGGAVARPRNLWVPVGTPLRCLLESAGGLREQAELILLGGPMMGTPVSDLEAPVIKSTNALICLNSWELRRPRPESICIRCGKCVSACPMHLAPSFIHRALQREEWDKLPALHPEDCMECGCCSYICPARIPLLEQVRQARQSVERGGAQ